MRKEISSKILPLKDAQRKEYNHIKVNVFFKTASVNFQWEHVKGGIIISVEPIKRTFDGLMMAWGNRTTKHLLDASEWNDDFADYKVDPEVEKDLIDKVLKDLGSELAE